MSGEPVQPGAIGLLSPFSPTFTIANRSWDIQHLKVEDECPESELSTIPEDTDTESIVWEQRLCSVPTYQGYQWPTPQLADHLLKMIKQWHDDYPKHIPPAALRTLRIADNWKIFDREKRKAAMSILEFSKPLRYKMLVLHVPYAADRFVAPIQGHTDVMFYKAWLGQDDYETDICAMRVYGGDADEVLASPSLPERISMASDKIPMRFAKTSSAALPKNLRRERDPIVPTRIGSTNLCRIAKENSNIQNKDMDNSGSDYAPARPRRSIRTKNRVQKGSNKPHKMKITKSHVTPGEVIIKLVAQNPEITRCFPLDACNTSDEFFQKATTFFCLLNKKLHVNILSCLIGKTGERRYLFNKSKGEFGIFVEDMKEIASHEKGKLIINVFCVN